MKLAIMSDLHNEFDRRGRREDVPRPLPAGHPPVGPDLRALQGRVDVLLLAGDIDEARASVRYGAAAAAYLGCPAVMVAGNHEFYHGTYKQVLAELRAEGGGHDNVVFLENDMVELALAGGGTLRVLGCSLWTDYALLAQTEDQIDGAMTAAADGLSDHWLVRLDETGRRFMPQDALALHRQSVDWLRRELAVTLDGTTVVMTHHGVSARSVPTQFSSDALSPCFVSALDDLVGASHVPLWIHGHTHYDVDYVIGETRIVARQRGYPHESGGFKPLIVDL